MHQPHASLTVPQQAHLAGQGVTRRDFARIAAFLASGTWLTLGSEPALAQLSQLKGMAPDAVRINANENPLGPCAEALDAVHKALANAGRYQFDLTDAFKQAMAAHDGLPVESVQAYAGSSAPLHQAVLAFCSPSRPFVTADPGYEAGEVAAKALNAKVIRVPLKGDFSHDVKAMAAADPNAGLIYLCNPNNPTGTLTQHADIVWLADHLPKGCVLLLDEAYIHVSGAPMASALVKAGKDVVILRTFSKIYGMAGLRAGAALGRPDLLTKIALWSAGPLPSLGMAAATASLQVADLVAKRRQLITEIREDTLHFLRAHGVEYVPSVSNCFMVKTPRPGPDVIAALRTHNVYIGRVWPSWPNHVRVSVGTAADMAKFQVALLQVLQGNAGPG